MKTSSFKRYDGPGRISIARFAPRGLKKGYRIFKKLAPGTWFKTASKPEYIKLYSEEVLKELDPQETYDTLCELAAPHEPVLLCWENAPLTEQNWCHRTLVAKWFERELGIKVPEV